MPRSRATKPDDATAEQAKKEAKGQAVSGAVQSKGGTKVDNPTIDTGKRKSKKGGGSNLAAKLRNFKL